MKGRLIEVRRIPLARRDSFCMMVEYDIEPSGKATPTEKKYADYEVVVLHPANSNLYGHTFRYCGYHLAVFSDEVEKIVSKQLSKASRRK